MLKHEKLSHVVAVALLLIAVQVIVFAEYFGITQPEDFIVAPTGLDINSPLPPLPPFVAINVREIDTTPQMYINVRLAFEILYPQFWFLNFEESPNGPIEFSNVPRDHFKEGELFPTWVSKVSVQKKDNCTESSKEWKEVPHKEYIAAEKMICKNNFQITLTTGRENMVNDNGGEILEFIASTFQMMDTDDPRMLGNWKTYRNEEYGFEFKYPSEWSYRIIGNNAYEENSFGLDFGLDTGSDPLMGKVFGTLSLSVVSTDNVSDEHSCQFKYDGNSEKININGIEMIKDRGVGYQAGYLLCFRKGDLIYYFSEGFFGKPGDKSRIEVLHSTFKFLP